MQRYQVVPDKGQGGTCLFCGEQRWPRIKVPGCINEKNNVALVDRQRRTLQGYRRALCTLFGMRRQRTKTLQVAIIDDYGHDVAVA